MKRLQAHESSFTFMELRGTHLDIGDNAKMSKKCEVARAGSTLGRERLEIDVTEGSECADALNSLGTRCAVITKATEVVLPVTTSTTQTKDLPRLQKSQKSAQAPKMETSTLALTENRSAAEKAWLLVGALLIQDCHGQQLGYRRHRHVQQEESNRSSSIRDAYDGLPGTLDSVRAGKCIGFCRAIAFQAQSLTV